MSNFAPMLAGKAPTDLSKLRYPVLASPKLDGIRAVMLDGRFLTRNLKPVPNVYIREWAEANLPDGFDGELLLRDWTAPFADVTSAVMSRDGEPDFTYAVFDWHGSGSFSMRLDALACWVGGPGQRLKDRLVIVPHVTVPNAVGLQTIIDLHIDQGYEGTMIRDPNGPYKCGRSTTKEGYLLKIKAFSDSTARVVGCEEEMENTNEATTDLLGRTKRSASKEGKIGKGRLGALCCIMDNGTLFSLGSGFTEAQRIKLWQSRDRLPEFVDFKHQEPPTGYLPGEAPRFPVFLRFRDADDL